MAKVDIFKTTKGTRVIGIRTICEIHREVYDAIVLNELDRAVELLAEAFAVGSRMAKRMIEQKIYDTDQLAAKETDKKVRMEIRERRIRLHKMLDELN